MISCIDRGLAPSDAKQMDIGHILDFCIQYNEMHDLGESEKKEKAKKRKANQGDWDAFFG